MQVQHETQLIEPSPIKSDDFISNYTQPLDQYTLNQSGFNSIEHLACSPVAQGGTILAIYSKSSNQITLIDTRNPARRDRFSLKSCDKRFSRQSFVVKGLDFSPDGTRLAVGQSDCIIYIYKIGQPEWSGNSGGGGGDSAAPSLGKPVISGKFVCSSPVTCLIWTEMGVVFGTRDGKVKLISFATSPKQQAAALMTIDQLNPQQAPQAAAQTKVINLYSSPKGAMPITLTSKVPVIAVGFVDGSVQILHLVAPASDPYDQAAADGNPSRRNSSYQAAVSSQSLTIDNECPPSQLALLQTSLLCCANSDGRLTFYSFDLEQGKSSSHVIGLKEEIVSIDYSATNDILAIITRNSLLFAILNAETNRWQLQTSSVEFLPAPTTLLTSIRWIREGAQLAVGTQLGSLELFKCSWNKQSLNDQLDICHIAKNRVRITDRERNLLATYKTSHDIKRVNLFDQGQNVLIWTTASLLMARLGVAQSEIKWRRDKAASKFYFHPAGYVIIFTPSMWELSLVKLGQDSLFFVTKLDSQRLSKNLLSLSCFPNRFLDSSSYSQRNGSSPSRKRGSEQSQLLVATTESLQVGRKLSASDEAESGARQSKQSKRTTEKLAHVSNSEQHLNLVDLADGSKRIVAKENEFKIVWLDLSRTGKYLAWKNSKNRLTVLQMKNDETDGRNDEIKLDHVRFCRWISDTDILVAQSAHKIYIWYKIELLHHPKVIDSRSYNLLKRAPIIDLSLSSAGAQRSVRGPEISQLTAANISLSNGCSIALDSLYIRFHREIIEFRLDAALRLLEKETNQERRVHLWAQLGWAAIAEEDMEMAIRAFGEINHSSMVDYLRECSRAEQLGKEERRWRLAKLNGDWDLFEQLQDPETVVATYKRLNKWSKCIEYLTKTQQFRQRDLAEQELRRWLIERGRHLEAAKIQAKQTGDLEGAIELLLEKQHHEEAAKLLLDEYKTAAQIGSPAVTRLKDQLVSRQYYRLAAKICSNILGERAGALDLFLKGKHYDEALALTTDQEQAARIGREFGDQLLAEFRQNKLTRRQAARSIQLYLDSGAFVEALEAAIELNEANRALELLDINRDRLSAKQKADFCERIAGNLLRENQKSLAIRAYELGEKYSEVVALSIEEKKFDEAFRVSLKYIHGDDRAAAGEEFKRLASEKIREENDLDSADKLYLMLGEIDSAIEMHRARGNHERMLQLVEQYQPESMERNLLLLAKEMEQAGRFEEAESYLLRAGPDEWTNVVRMYRLANRWDGAYRVARQHCQSTKDPLLVQLAYFWAKSELTSSAAGSVEKTLALLDNELGCRREVIEFSCENNNYAFAIELCGPGNSDEKRRIVKKYAKYLEKNQDLRRAEEVLVQNDQLEEAARMYVDNELHMEAIRLIEDAQQSSAGSSSSSSSNQLERQLVELLNRTLVEAATKIAGQAERNGVSASQQLSAFGARGGPSSGSGQPPNDGDRQLAMAQQLYLRAQRPDLAIEMYKRCGLWQEAIQLAQRFAPQLLEGVERDLDAQVSLDLKQVMMISSGSNGNHSASSMSSKLSRSSSRSSSSTTANTMNGATERGYDESSGYPPDAADQFLQSRAERHIRRGQDPKSTRQALGKLLSNLAEGDSQNEASFLILAEKLAPFEQQQQQQNSSHFLDREAVGRVHSLADQLFRISCPLIGGGTLEHIWLWQRFRNLIGKSLAPTTDHSDASMHDDRDLLTERSERRLLALHYTLLHRSLSDRVLAAGRAEQRQPSAAVLSPAAAERLRAQLNTADGKQQLAPLVGLLSKLSMSLLRYSDLLDARACFLSAGFWTLADGRASFARFAWSRLVELCDRHAASSSGSDRLERQLGQADCPRSAINDADKLVSSKYRSLGEIRSWLIESLLENRASLELSPLDTDGQLESSLRGGKLRPCLVSGYPVSGQQQQQQQQQSSPAKQPNWSVNQADWRALKMLASESEQDANTEGRRTIAAKRTKQQRLADCVQFIEQLIEQFNK